MSAFPPFTVRAPASTANLGSAFDAVGMALDLWLTVRVESAAENRIDLLGEGADSLGGAAEDNLIFRAAARGASRLRVELPPVRVTAKNDIPLARGLGSSAAATAAGLLIAAALARKNARPEEMLQDAAELEGHPDNVAPALLGGVCLAVARDDAPPIARALSFPHDLACVAFVPDAVLSTTQARSALPSQVPLRDASFNVTRAALLIQAFMTGEWVDLGLATEDRLHQPYRAPLVPGLSPLSQAARAAGAYAAFLSGAGPTVMSLTAPSRADAVAAAMSESARSLDIAGRALVLAPSERGAHIVTER